MHVMPLDSERVVIFSSCKFDNSIYNLIVPSTSIKFPEDFYLCLTFEITTQYPFESYHTITELGIT